MTKTKASVPTAVRALLSLIMTKLSLMRKYLIIAPSWVGDMVMSQSLYRFIKSQDPNCIIDIAAPKHCCDLAQFMPEINEAFELEFKHGQFSFNARKQKALEFKGEGYSDAIVLPNSWKSALIPFFAHIKKRTGWHGEMRFVLLNDRRKLNKTKYPLMIERFCALGIAKKEHLPTKLPYPKFNVDSNLVETTLAKYRLSKDKAIIALCPGAEFGPAKKWPSAYYTELAQYLLDQNYQVLLLGGTKDQQTTSDISKGCNHHAHLFNLAGKTTLSEAVYLLASCQRVISNDSGLMHIACALNIPTLVIYGSTSDKFTPPLNTLAKSVYLEDLDCRPCFKRECPLEHMDCMNKLLPQKIIAELEKLPLSLPTSYSHNPDY
ncbi:lipopolysaccharide heptosyltransferase II [Cysteiniphilum sp. 6C5]|uniref:lipopolysaccharide heptosyltransferase II n=2 Tax=unclassified Cysteiniphilum TaxID=2610889 RepID=UPI003F879FA6